MEIKDPILTPEEVSEWTTKPVETLYDWRHKGIGPRSFKVGRNVRYLTSEVQAWLDEQVRAEPDRAAAR